MLSKIHCLKVRAESFSVMIFFSLILNEKYHPEYTLENSQSSWNAFDKKKLCIKLNQY